MHRFVGHIMGAAFASGHRIVVGRWSASPLGGFSDVMWRRPDGTRLLIAPDEGVADFMVRHYSFDEVLVGSVAVERTRDRIDVRADDLELRFDLRPMGPMSLLLRIQPAAVATDPRWIQLIDSSLRPLIAPLLFSGKTRLVGRTRAGAREWYAIRDLRRADASARVNDHDVGSTGDCPAAGFGFSEFPDPPALVRVTSLFDRL
jgi:hypothetical protein